MRKHFILLLSLFIALVAKGQSKPLDYVNVLMGTMSTYELSNGNTYPVIARPWGMNFWTPQTGKNGDGWQYTYTANKIQGFKQTHQPSPWMNDYGQFSIMPVAGEPVSGQKERASWFSHKAEVAKPHYYSVYLADHDTRVALSPTERGAIFNIQYPEYKENHLVIDVMDEKSSITVDIEGKTITGYSTKNSGGVPENFRNYFVIKSEVPFVVASKDSTTLVVSFPKGSNVILRIASSFISPEQALINLEEVECKSFEEIVFEGKEEWNTLLGRFEIRDSNINNIRSFYSTLYRSLLFPRRLYEIDRNGNIYHYSPFNGEVLPGYMYTDTGFWDTFRSLFPLLNLFYPEEAQKMQEGLVNTYKESGFLPEWVSPGHRNIMIGNNSASVVADAFVKGVGAKDMETLWEAVVHGAHSVHPEVKSTGRIGHEYYNKLGYVPYNIGINESAARTLEYAYDDWSIYQLGKALGKPEKEIDIYRLRSLNYKNLYDSGHRLMRGKNEDGTWQSPFNPLKWGDAFTEGNSWHYTWSVFHDPQGLIDLMGGRKGFVQMLDSLFSVPPLFDDSYYGFVIHEIREMQIVDMGNYAHGNQPIQHAIYLYNYAGEPWKAQYYVREVMEKLYAPTPDGYCGDEDNGQTSAWYVFSALGFYPVCPGTLEYVIGSPLFEEVVVHLPNGRKLTLSAPGNRANTRFISGISVNSKQWGRNYLTHTQLLNGGKILFKMSSDPDYNRGTNIQDAPYSLSNEK
ncbi:MAG: GH92 family glycosyl hydrolase [Bacteroidales bacterium]|uniref:GH92 family glycosyl hydrolase n=1 Tax=Porphyromonas sp. TaxID=1924944 RepID=UPI0029716390|nr:GH92 family glycosyl hydrolase [Porphyromonas sp.]MDD7438156.1 GH92 family glycosyl hydrolase [Bacteroidales bacterium]MDY3066803.1 GH92 family glycosyl hydrolase [Porphyromonas sp.]